MRALVLSTTYGARGDGKSAFALAGALARAEVDVTVVTHGESGAGELSARGIRVVFVGDHPPMIPSWDRLPWTLQANSALMAATTGLDPDVVHAVGWDVVWAASAARAFHSVPLVASTGTPVVHPDAPEGHKHAVARAHAWLLAEADARAELPVRWTAAQRGRMLGIYEDVIKRGHARRKPVRARGDVAAELA